MLLTKIYINVLNINTLKQYYYRPSKELVQYVDIDLGAASTRVIYIYSYLYDIQEYQRLFPLIKECKCGILV